LVLELDLFVFRAAVISTSSASIESSPSAPRSLPSIFAVFPDCIARFPPAKRVEPFRVVDSSLFFVMLASMSS